MNEIAKVKLPFSWIKKCGIGFCEKHGDTIFYSIKGAEPCCGKCNDEDADKISRVIPTTDGIPPELYRCTFDNYEAKTASQQRQLDQVRTIANNIGSRIVVFLGSYGLGKSHLAVACLKKVGGLYIKASDMVREYNGAFPSDRQRLFDTWMAKRLMVIDEVGTGKTKDELPLIQDIIATRYDSHLSLILISNMVLDDFLDYVGGLIKSRLISSRGEYISFEGQDYRQLA